MEELSKIIFDWYLLIARTILGSFIMVKVGVCGRGDIFGNPSGFVSNILIKGESKGYGFVEYSEPIEKISQIKTKLDWSVIEGNTVHCDAVIDRTAHGLMFEDLHSKCLLINNLPLDYKDPIELRELFSKFHKPVYCQVRQYEPCYKKICHYFLDW